jgi:hypothetical protein
MRAFIFLLCYLVFIAGILGSIYCFYELVWCNWNNPYEWLFWVKWFISFGAAAIISRITTNLLARLNNSNNVPPPAL